jgi:hypothetical protein
MKLENLQSAFSGKLILLLNSYIVAIPPDYPKTYTLAGGDWGLAVFFWETAEKRNPVNPVNPV